MPVGLRSSSRLASKSHVTTAPKSKPKPKRVVAATSRASRKSKPKPKPTLRQSNRYAGAGSSAAAGYGEPNVVYFTPSRLDSRVRKATGRMARDLQDEYQRKQAKDTEFFERKDRIEAEGTAAERRSLASEEQIREYRNLGLRSFHTTPAEQAYFGLQRGPWYHDYAKPNPKAYAQALQTMRKEREAEHRYLDSQRKFGEQSVTGLFDYFLLGEKVLYSEHDYSELEWAARAQVMDEEYLKDLAEFFHGQRIDPDKIESYRADDPDTQFAIYRPAPLFSAAQ